MSTTGKPQLREKEKRVPGVLLRMMKDENGATALEYGLIATLISVAIIAGAAALGDQVSVTFNTLNTKVDAANG